MTDQKFLIELVTALGYDLEQVLADGKQEAIVGAAEALGRIRTAIATTSPDISGSVFICGINPERDETGFPEDLSVCLKVGTNIIQTYKKSGKPYITEGL